MSHGDPAKPFLQALTESKLEDETAVKFLAAVERFCKQKRFVPPIEFPADHPVEKLGRMLMACLLKHQELGKFMVRQLSQSMATTPSTLIRHGNGAFRKHSSNQRTNDTSMCCSLEWKTVYLIITKLCCKKQTDKQTNKQKRQFAEAPDLGIQCDACTWSVRHRWINALNFLDLNFFELSKHTEYYGSNFWNYSDLPLTGNAALSILESEVHSPVSPRSASTQDVTTTTTVTAPPQSSTTHGPPVTVPKPVSEVLKVVYQTKCALVRVSFFTPQCLWILYPPFGSFARFRLSPWSNDETYSSCNLQALYPAALWSFYESSHLVG